MARKKRRTVQPEVAATGAAGEQNKPKTVYRDSFQEKVGTRIEDVGKKVDGRKIVYAVIALGALLIGIGIFYVWNKRSSNAADTALGKAIETSQAQVTASPPPAGSTAKTFATERQRAEAAIAEFQAVAEKYGGETRERAKYFIAVNKMSVDRNAAIGELTELANASGEVGTLSKFALAQANASDGKFDDAVRLYQEILGLNQTVVAADTLNFELAKIYEKQGKTAEAADIYFNIAKAASEAKDPEGKAIPPTDTATQAKKKIEELNPERAKEIKEPEPETPPGFPGM